MQYRNYRTISLIRQPSNITLRIVLSRLQTKTEELLAEEQAGFRPGRRIKLQQSSHHKETPTKPACFVSQLHRLQGGVRQSLACRPAAAPQKLQCNVM